jgi:HEAT repeat protein
LALGALGLGIAVSVGVWARGELEAFRVAAAADSERTMVVQREFAARLEASEIEERSRRELSASEAREEWMNLRAEVAELRTRGDAGLADLSAKLAEASQRMAALDLSLASVARHDAELVSVQQKLVELRAAVDALSTELSTKLAEVRRAGGSAGSAAETEDPAWLALLEQLRSANVSERYVALVGLASSRDPRATAEVLPSLKDADIFLRMAAARALGDLASRDAISALIDALDDEEALVREAAYLSLRSITQRDLPFDAHSPDAAERAKRIKAWREWWEKERPKAG